MSPRARSDAQITREITALFADPEIQEEQRRTTVELAAFRSPVGREW